MEPSNLSPTSARRPLLFRSLSALPDLSPPKKATSSKPPKRSAMPYQHHRQNTQSRDLDSSAEASTVQLHKDKFYPQSAVNTRLPLSPSPETISRAATIQTPYTSRRGSLVVSGDGAESTLPDNNTRILDTTDPAKAQEDRIKRNEELNKSLHTLSNLASTTTRRLDNTYINLLEKARNLQSTIGQLEELSSATTRLYREFEFDTQTSSKEISDQVDSLGGFKIQQIRIAQLEERVKFGKQKVEKLNKRLGVAREHVRVWEKKEGEWQAKTSRRIRMLWGATSALLLGIMIMMIIKHVAHSRALDRIPTVPETRKTAGEIYPHIGDRPSSGADVVSHPHTTGISTISLEEDPTLHLFDEL